MKASERFTWTHKSLSAAAGTCCGIIPIMPDAKQECLGSVNCIELQYASIKQNCWVKQELYLFEFPLPSISQCRPPIFGLLPPLPPLSPLPPIMPLPPPEGILRTELGFAIRALQLFPSNLQKMFLCIHHESNIQHTYKSLCIIWDKRKSVSRVLFLYCGATWYSCCHNMLKNHRKHLSPRNE